MNPPPASNQDYWVHDLSPYLLRFPESFPIDGIRFYGLAYLLGFAAAFAIFNYYRRKDRSPLSAPDNMDLFTYLLAGVIVGGRLGYVILYDGSGFLANPLIIFQVWKGGMASHGGFIGVAVALWVFARVKKVPFLRVTDLVVSVAPLGLFFGRIANFINGELWGTPSRLPWAVLFPDSPLSPTSGEPVPRHPSQLYQALGEGLLLFAWLQWRFWRQPALSPGRLSGEFLVGYAVVRFLVEFVREPDAPLIAGLSRGQFYSIPVLIVGVVVMVLSIRKERRGKEAAQGRTAR